MSAAASPDVKSLEIEPAAIRTRSPNFGARMPSVLRYWNGTKFVISACRTATPPSLEVDDEETIFTLAKMPAASTARTSRAPPASAVPSSSQACTALLHLVHRDDPADRLAGGAVERGGRRVGRVRDRRVELLLAVRLDREVAAGGDIGAGDRGEGLGLRVRVERVRDQRVAEDRVDRVEEDVLRRPADRVERERDADRGLAGRRRGQDGRVDRRTSSVPRRRRRRRP